MGLGITKPKWHLLKNGLIAGLTAITVNTLLLRLAPLVAIKAEGGGLLKLLLRYGRPLTGHIAFLYTPLFAVSFHYLTGLVMVMIYVGWFNRLIKMPGWLKGSFFCLRPWLINGFIVLPLLGLGVLGHDKLSPTGMSYFFTHIGFLVGYLDGYLIT